MATGKFPFPWISQGRSEPTGTTTCPPHHLLPFRRLSSTTVSVRHTVRCRKADKDFLAIAWSSFQRSRHSALKKTNTRPAGVQTFHVSTRLSPLHWPEMIISTARPPAYPVFIGDRQYKLIHLLLGPCVWTLQLKHV